MVEVHAISFDYGHVLGGIDLDELAARLHDRDGSRTVDPSVLRAAMPAAYRAHDETIANGRGHEGAWRALMRTLVAAGWPSSGRDDAPPAKAIDDAVDALWRAQPIRNLWRHVPAEARALLADLDAHGVPMVLTSNSEGRVRELVEEVGIARHFRAILDSGLLGFAKPDPRIFELAAQRAGVEPRALVHVGDSEQADVQGARRAGVRAIRFDGFVLGASRTPTVADARVSTYPELRAVLSEWLRTPL
jgi:putative hydrolase of the HAD superfamily